MTKLRKTLMAAGVLLLSSVAFVGCSDDSLGTKLPGNKLGASYIQAITAGATSVDLHWTISPGPNVEGYLVQIYQGTHTNVGSLVTEQKFGDKEYEATFTGLQPFTEYVVFTQCIPAAGSKYTDADVAYWDFSTSPIFTFTSVSTVVSESTDEDGNTIYKTDEDGNETTDPVYEARITINWAENWSTNQVNGVMVNVYHLEPALDEDGEPVIDDNGNVVMNQISNYQGTVNTGASTGTTVTVTAQNVEPGETYYISLIPNPTNYCWYTTASADTGDRYEFTMPAAQ